MWSVAPSAGGGDAGTRGGWIPVASLAAREPDTLSRPVGVDETAELSGEVAVPLPTRPGGTRPASPPTGGFLRKIAGTIAMVIISRIAQMVRRSMDSVHVVRGQGRTRPDETDGSERGVGRRASSP